ncbi:NAD(P)-binding protein [Hypoxylon trugodes]|uniref:NAD(P)-binding protein n=1 Tax=Hypoxylon trugodes TaxID=326681 RepID=UPI0021A1A323|nr:NAD(P)-binding protein [Hypoxylon trugodes]KAI1387126.1 NAD(P)-binding protein [Hypoxylon trugodes]
MSQYLESRAAFESHFVGFLYRQWLMYPKPIPRATTLKGQTAIVTGANSGLGYETARQLLQLGLTHLIVGVRSQARGDAAAAKLRDEFPGSKIWVWIVDMVSYDSVTAFARRCETLPRIDIVLLNAGLISIEFTLIKATQHEQTGQVNYLSTALLTVLLLPILKSKKSSSPGAQPPRLSVVASDTFYWAPPFKTGGPVLPQLDEIEGFAPMKVYSRSKLLQMMFFSRLAEQVNADDVVVNVCNPGLCRDTSFGGSKKQTSLGDVIFWFFININGRTVKAGTSAVVDALVAKGAESHGSYVSDWSIQP